MNNIKIDEKKKKISIEKLYTQYKNEIADDKIIKIDFMFDDFEKTFLTKWSDLKENITNPLEETKSTVENFIESQPDILAFTLAMSRTDYIKIFPKFKRFLEFVTKSSEKLAGHKVVIGIPHALAGFLYMTSVIMSLRYEKWNILNKLLNEKFEWYYQSGRALYSYGFEHSYFFHSEAFARNAPDIHDFYYKLLINPDIVKTTGLDGEDLLSLYCQAQMLMCLKVSQLVENNDPNISPIWADYGRYYENRVIPLLDRMHHEKSYAEGICSALSEPPESPDVFFENLNNRLNRISNEYFRSSSYFWSSIRSWEPR